MRNARRHGSLSIALEPNTPRTTCVLAEWAERQSSLFHCTLGAWYDQFTDDEDLYASDMMRRHKSHIAHNQYVEEHCPGEARNNLRFEAHKGRIVKPVIGP